MKGATMPKNGGTLEEAFAQADADINNEGSQEETQVEEEVVEGQDEPETTDEPESEPAESEEDNSESFTKVNPEELPEELKGVYKSLQADYTRKTQEAAKIRKESESRISELEDKLKELESPSQPKSQRQQLKDFVKSEIEAEKVEEFRDQAISEYEAADPRLRMDGENYDKATDLFVGQEMDSKLQEHVENGEPQYTFDYKKALKESLNDWDSYLQTKKEAFLKAQHKQAKQKSKKVQKQNPKSQTGRGRPKKVSLDEAIQLARQNA